MENAISYEDYYYGDEYDELTDDDHNAGAYCEICGSTDETVQMNNFGEFTCLECESHS